MFPMSKSKKRGKDYAPQNWPPKHIVKYIKGSKVSWLQEPGSFGGHKVRKNGHRMVSGIVRAKMKDELIRMTDELQEQIDGGY